jgi:ABC-type protease/lipase transport system fused ATPase/permease subunit
VRLPDPTGALLAQKVVASAPGGDTPILKDVSLALEPGECLGVVGPSGSGKSTLARVLAGAWRIDSGVVRLDGADIAQIDDGDLGRHVGYLPQDVHLFPGTVADNISRFERCDAGADIAGIERDLVHAAQSVDAHRMILQLPNGYETQVGLGGAGLSGGQRQRIGLARAIYRSPPLLVLDEPNSFLDADGERALMDVIAACKRRGGAIVVVAHRASILAQADSLILLRDGMVADVGRRDEVIRRLNAVPHLAAVKVGGGPA